MRYRHCGAYTKFLSETQYAALNRSYDPGALLLESAAETLRRILQVDEGKAILAPIIESLAGEAQPRVFYIDCGQGAILLAAREMGSAK